MADPITPSIVVRLAVPVVLATGIAIAYLNRDRLGVDPMQTWIGEAGAMGI